MDRSSSTGRRFPLRVLVCFALAMSALGALAQGVRVEAILLNDKEADQAPAVIVITAQVPAGERRLLKRNDVFAAGFEIVAPAMTVIVFRSDNGNRIVLEPGARIRVADVTKTGERYLLRTGSVFFEVLKALSFFNVEFDEQFVALVRGTQFRVSGDEGGRFTCEVLSGEVVVQRSERIQIGSAERPILARSSILLSLDGKRKVEWTKANTEEIRSFATLEDADRYLGAKLEQAKLDRLDSFMTHAQLLVAGGYKNKALETYIQAETGAGSLPYPDPRVAELYVRRADLLAEMNRAQEALSDYDKARRIYNELYTPDASREVARVLTSEGDVYAKLRRYDVAAEKFREAIDVETKVTLGRETPRIRRNIDSIDKLHQLAPKKVRPADIYRFAPPIKDLPLRDER